MKAGFQSLSDAYVADFDELISQLPEGAKKVLTPFREQLTKLMDQQQESIATEFASHGDDSTPIPEEGRDSIISALKTTRDQLKEAMTGARKQALSMLQ